MTIDRFLTRKAHRRLATLLAMFLSLHLLHHMTLLGGTDLHLRVQAVISPLYRWLPIEVILLALFLVQITIGGALAQRLSARAKGWRRVQIMSGAVLGGFILIHAAAALAYRAQGLPSTVHFAASGMFHPVWRWYFILYYPAGIVALLTHLAAHLALRRIGPGWLPWSLPFAGLIYAGVVLVGVSGGFGGAPPPPAYLYSGSILP